MKKYCCERFETRALLPREKGLNIRIVKVDSHLLLDKENPYRYFIVPAYHAGEKGVPIMPIAYCPFCGTHLFSYLQSDEYINEEYANLRP